MRDWIFLGEQIEAGIVFQLGLNPSTGRCYRFEPLATRLRGNLAGVLRQEIERRSLVVENQNQGIIPVIGPIFSQDRYWIGWEDRTGRNLFATERKIRKTLREELADLYPLINSYSLWRQVGLTVGRPEWRRLSMDENGIFMLDPKLLLYLSQPCYNPPDALERCRPPEEYRNQPPECAGDVFYLGLIIYYYLTGEIPFRLRKGWPTEAILNGDVINPQLYRPKLPPGLVRVIMSMLDPEALRRPTFEEIKGIWNEYLKTDAHLVKSNSKDNLKWFSGYKMNRGLTKTGLKWAISISVLVLAIYGISYFYPMLFNHPSDPPLKAAANFYEGMERVDLHSKKGTTTRINNDDFGLAVKRRLDMVAVLLSKPVFEVEQMRLVDETPDKAIIEADLIWWEWSAEGWVRRNIRERLVFRKQGKQTVLESRNQL